MNTSYRRFLSIAVCIVALSFCIAHTDASTFVLSTVTTKDYVLELHAQPSVSPTQITIEWPFESDGVSYYLYRKTPSQITWGLPIAIVSASTTYIDTNVVVGTPYEYRVLKNRATAPLGVFGYVYSGISLPVADSRGTVVLITDATSVSGLSTEVSTLTQDLIYDGWKVVTHSVARSASVATVKSLIVTDYNADPTNVKQVFLLGHVAVPYSGELNPDGHDDHLGAWPADVYYGDINSNLWTDTTLVSQNSGVPARNVNVPGDGKFDQTVIPSAVELAVGRVDLYDMPSFTGRTEQDLLRSYLAKDHNFRLTNLSVAPQAIVADAFGAFGGEAFAQSGWRNFSALVGGSITEELTTSNFPSDISAAAYLWAYAAAGSTFTTMYGVIATSDYAANPLQAVFSLMYGSRFGDWDTTDNLLRAPLASGLGLSNIWSGRPLMYMQSMALGKTLGDGLVLSQNNQTVYTPTNTNTGKVHIALMGDPTLRQIYALPPSGLSATGSTNNTLSWTASLDPSSVGYYIYRSNSSNGPYTRISADIITATNYTDSALSVGTYYYLVKTVILKTSPTGSYYDTSEGTPITVFVVNTAPVVSVVVPSNTTLLNTVFLSAAVSDDGLSGGPVTGLWTVSGPGSVLFANATSTSTTATVSTAGSYVFTYTATDTLLSGSSSGTTTVSAAPVSSSGGGGSYSVVIQPATLLVQPQRAPVTIEKKENTEPRLPSVGKILKTGSVDAEVKLLQHFLNQKGFPVAINGRGSLGKETSSFGSFTQKALIRFQKKYKIPQTGKLDVKTRTLIASFNL